jgi:hypothetical protein
MDRTKAYEAISQEREYQAIKHGEHPHAVAEWIILLEEEIQEAKHAWKQHGNDAAMSEIIQVAALAVAAMEQHGAQADPVHCDLVWRAAVRAGIEKHRAATQQLLLTEEEMLKVTEEAMRARQA